MSYVYILSEDWREDGIRHQLFTVGFYKPDGEFEGDSDHGNKDDASARVRYLNGGMNSELEYAITTLCEQLSAYGIATYKAYE